MGDIRQALPSQEECLRGVSAVMANADRHLRCARRLADLQEFGPASALLVLAGEEAMKALMLQTYGIGFAEMERAMRPMLFQHEPRHAGALVLTMFTGVLGRRLSLMLEVLEKFPEQERSGPEFVQAIQEAKERFMTEVKEMLDPSHGSAFSRKLLWWTTANDLKIRGLYVDFRDGSWSSPGSLSQEEFEETLRIIEPFVQEMRAAISSWESVPAKEQVEMTERIKQAYEDSRRHRGSSS